MRHYLINVIVSRGPLARLRLGSTRKPWAKRKIGLSLALALVVATGECQESDLANLGRLLFFDTNLSNQRTQSCATCHDPNTAFVDLRNNNVDRAASIGDDGHSIGDRNTPSAAYAAATPNFHRNSNGENVGGFFLDGRAASLRVQAIEPLFNPKELALRDPSMARERIMENPLYIEILTRLYGEELFDNADALVEALGASLSEFEKTELFSPFSSKYDRFLAGEYQMTALEEFGRSLFFSPLTNCTSCHLINSSSTSKRETFTNYRYHNIGLPTNIRLRAANRLAGEYLDHGLLGNPSVDDVSLDGKFKVPSLRNVAVTAPYMHNGIFKELSTAILFYNKYTVINQQSRTNPETGKPWGEAEVPLTVDLDLLNQGQPIDQARVKALIAFLETLTDKRYETLLK